MLSFHFSFREEEGEGQGHSSGLDSLAFIPCWPPGLTSRGMEQSLPGQRGASSIADNTTASFQLLLRVHRTGCPGDGCQENRLPADSVALCRAALLSLGMPVYSTNSDILIGTSHSMWDKTPAASFPANQPSPN